MIDQSKEGAVDNAEVARKGAVTRTNFADVNMVALIVNSMRVHQHSGTMCARTRVCVWRDVFSNMDLRGSLCNSLRVHQYSGTICAMTRSCAWCDECLNMDMGQVTVKTPVYVCIDTVVLYVP